MSAQHSIPWVSQRPGGLEGPPTAHEQLKPGFNHRNELQILQMKDFRGGPVATPCS